MTKKHDTEKHEQEGGDEYVDDIVIEEEGETGADQVKKLRERLKTCLAERQEYLEGWQRMRADFTNVKKEHEEKLSFVRKHASEALIEDLLPVLDSFDMAFANKEAWEKVDKGWRDGVTYIHSQLLSALGGYGLAPIDPAGQKFDPKNESSLEVVPTDDPAQDDVIAEVLQKGYKLHERIIRPAKVKVFSHGTNDGNGT